MSDEGPAALSLVRRRTDIVDAQIHIGPGGLAAMLAKMDAIGIAAALIDECWVGQPVHDMPHQPLPDGAWRPIAPTAELAALLHPDRFSWMLRLHRRDPEYGALIRIARDAPGCRALRIDPGVSPAEMRIWAMGGYDHILGAAADWDLPIIVFAPDLPEAFERAARSFPTLRIGIDSCGVLGNRKNATIAARAAPLDETARAAMFGRVCELAALPNVALKWGHASTIFDEPGVQGTASWSALRRAVDAFGPTRVFWESDYAVNQCGETWAEQLFAFRACALLRDDERELMLGGALRMWLGWLRQ